VHSPPARLLCAISILRRRLVHRVKSTSLTGPATAIPYNREPPDRCSLLSPIYTQWTDATPRGALSNHSLILHGIHYRRPILVEHRSATDRHCKSATFTSPKDKCALQRLSGSVVADTRQKYISKQLAHVTMSSVTPVKADNLAMMIHLSRYPCRIAGIRGSRP
jgi:hypothetical protein